MTDSEKLIEAPGKLLFRLIEWPVGWDADVPEGAPEPRMELGSLVVNGWASIGNPHRVGIYYGKDTKHAKFTDGVSRWATMRKDSRFAVIGHLRDFVIAAKQVEDADSAGYGPIDVVLFCPKCKVQHVDKPEPDICKCGHHDADHFNAGERNICGGGGADRPLEDIFAKNVCKCENFEIAWNNPPHKSHLCHGCGIIWRPADVPTNGVERATTIGERDTYIADLERPQTSADIGECGHPEDWHDIGSGNARTDNTLDKAAAIKAWNTRAATNPSCKSENESLHAENVVMRHVLAEYADEVNWDFLKGFSDLDDEPPLKDRWLGDEGNGYDIARMVLGVCKTCGHRRDEHLATNTACVHIPEADGTRCLCDEFQSGGA